MNLCTICDSSLVLHVRPDDGLIKMAETCCLSFDSLYLNEVLLCFDLPTLSIEILHTHILRIYTTYCFSKATMVMQTRLYITLYVHPLSCLLLLVVKEKPIVTHGCILVFRHSCTKVCVCYVLSWPLYTYTALLCSKSSLTLLIPLC